MTARPGWYSGYCRALEQGGDPPPGAGPEYRTGFDAGTRAASIILSAGYARNGRDGFVRTVPLPRAKPRPKL